MEAFEDDTTGLLSKSDLTEVLEKIGNKNGVSSDKLAQLVSNTYALADPGKTG